MEHWVSSDDRTCAQCWQLRALSMDGHAAGLDPMALSFFCLVPWRLPRCNEKNCSVVAPVPLGIALWCGGADSLSAYRACMSCGTPPRTGRPVSHGGFQCDMPKGTYCFRSALVAERTWSGSCRQCGHCKKLIRLSHGCGNLL